MQPACRFAHWVVATGCLLLASCSDSDDGLGLSCDVAPASEMSSTLGVGDLGGPTAEESDGALLCSYSAGDDRDAVILRVLEVDASAFAAGRQMYDAQGLATQDVTGLGNDAYSVTDATAVTVVAWDGTYEVQLSATTGSSVEALSEMISAILVRLGG